MRPRDASPAMDDAPGSLLARFEQTSVTRSQRYLVPRRCNPEGPLETFSRRGAATSTGGPSRKLICVHTPANPQGAECKSSSSPRSLPLSFSLSLTRSVSISAAFTLQNHIIHLFTHLSVLRAAGIVRLIELPEACAAGYHARRSPYFALSAAPRTR